MKFGLLVKNIFLFIVVFTFLSFSGRGSNFESGLSKPDYMPVVTGEVIADTITGPLQFPFEDEPAFGSTEQKDPANLYLNQPNNLRKTVEFDPVSGKYVFYERIGNLNYRLPQTMSLEDYRDYDIRKSINDYWKARSHAESLQGDGSLIPKLTINNEYFNRIFGGNTIDIRPQGYVEVSLGYKENFTDNPNISERLRRVPSFDFDQQIQMSVTGKIGTKVDMRVNFNTEATFDFENKMNLEHTGEEDDILKRIEAGNVSLPLNGTLITGASNLFGVKAEMQFGKLTLTALASQYKGESSTVETEGGAQITTFDISAVDYDANRHFFLSQFFRDQYNDALKDLPIIRSSVVINKIEIWVTNKSSNFTESRNLIAMQDLGEHDPHIYNNIADFQQTYGLPYPQNVYPHNNANGMHEALGTTYSGIRQVENISSVMAQFGTDFQGGRDFEKIEQARKLTSSEYTINRNLGYISLNAALNSDEVLAVAYNYTVNGEVFQVGEFSTDGIDAPQTLILKLLKGTNLSPSLPTWDLMMKNVYNLNAYSLSSSDFVLNVNYLNDSTGTYINYIPEGRINRNILLRVLNLDKLNSQLDPYPDGVFDYIDSITVQSNTGRIVFPMLEPFGKHLADSIQDPVLIQKYTFQSLYDSTKVFAEQDAEHNKFRLAGHYKGSSSAEIVLGGYNLTPGSVKVTAGGVELIENIDYTVDYTLGRVRIINQALLDSGTNIQATSESGEMISSQRKTMLGLHANYAFSDRFNLGATMLYMHERPLTQKVEYGSEPISNMILGLDTRYSTESGFITRMIDKLPFIDTKAPSTIDVEAEFAKLFAGTSKTVGSDAAVYIDDFESTKTSLDLKSIQTWTLASAPQMQPNLFPEANLINEREYGFNRALLAWYNIDPLFLRNTSLTPSHIKNDPAQQKNHFVREVFEKEIFPAKESAVGEVTNIPVLDLAYYPSEKGPYNYDTYPTSYSAGINSEGFLNNPASRWGGIMRKIETTDFENANVEFIEFWLMDPFVYNEDGTMRGGRLSINLGEISEDILRDGRKSFENGLPTSTEVSHVDTTVWGRVSTQQSLVNAFDSNSAARAFQDVGLDGLRNEDEKTFFAEYLENVRQIVSSDVYNDIMNDPSGDNYHYYRGSDYDAEQKTILERYKKYNGMDGNSVTTENSPESYPTAATSTPNIEDINNDNTLNENERYYQYNVSLRPEDMVVGQNYITDVRLSRVDPDNSGQVLEVNWYQFKIPVREYDQVIGSISDFKSIRFMRIFLTDFEEPTFLRFATLNLVRADWRRYTNSLADEGVISSEDTSFDISSVNIEENAGRTPINYILPPGIDRVVDPANPQLLQLNEQSMVLKVIDLEQGDVRAAYKSIYLDFRYYERLKMEIHAEEISGYPVEDGDMKFFIRLGSDYNNNYYEYELPLSLTPHGRYNGELESDRYIVWPDANRINIPLELFTNVKLARDAAIRNAGSTITIQDVFEIAHPDWNNGNNMVKVKGNPNLGNVEVMMMGVRNHKKQVNTGPKSIEVWVNEMRLTDVEQNGGWAANARVTARLADLGSVTVAGRHRSSGFGDVNQSTTQRNLDNLSEIDITTSLDLGRFFPKKVGVRLPLYYSYSRSNSMPKYNPLNPDIELKESLNQLDSKHERDSIRHIAQDLIVRKSLNFTNIKVEPEKKEYKSPKPWDPGNFSASYSYNETFKRNADTEYNIDKIYRGAFSYNFNAQPKSVEPFKKVEFLNKGLLTLIGGFNFNPYPNQISFRTDMYRRYNEVQGRNITNPDMVLPTTFQKDFLWNRNFDIRYDVTRSLKIDFSSNATARIDEPEGRINRRDDDYEWKRDSIVSNILSLGRPVLYNHTVNGSYMLPFNRVKMLNFISGNITYNGSYNWAAGSITADTIRLGNQVQNSQNIQMSGTLNLTTLYNKVPYLNKIDQKFQRTSRISNRGRQGSTRQNAQGQQTQAPLPAAQEKPEYVQKNVNLKKDVPTTISHRLNLKTANVSAVDSDGNVIEGRMRMIDGNILEFTPTADAASAEITVTGKLDKNILKDVLDIGVRMLTGIRNIYVSYGVAGGTVFPGYLPQPTIFGAGVYTPDGAMFGNSYSSSTAPGFPFLMGWQDRNFAKKAADKGWLTTDPLLNLPFQFNRTERFNIRVNVEPLPDLRIDVNANRTISKNLSEYYSYDNVSRSFDSHSLSESGNFSMTVFTWGTAFFAIGKEEVQQSQAFEDFKANRAIIANRLAHSRPANNGYVPGSVDPETGYPDGYGPTSIEVLVPSFLAAYQGTDPNKVSLSLFPSIKYIRPNWRVQYEGMVSKIPALNKIFKTMNLTHQYNSSYTMGSFLTNLNYMTLEDGFSYVRDVQNNFIPAYEFNSVSINETFNPLLNIDITWINDLTTRSEFKRARSISLSFANNQITEVLSSELIVGLGYRFTRMDLIIKTKNSQRAYSNDLTLRADLAFRKNKTILRRLVEETDQLTAGQSATTLKFTADYMLSDRFQMQLYFDKVINNPFITTTYKTANTNIGVSFRFTLAQ